MEIQGKLRDIQKYNAPSLTTNRYCYKELMRGRKSIFIENIQAKYPSPKIRHEKAIVEMGATFVQSITKMEARGDIKVYFTHV